MKEYLPNDIDTLLSKGYEIVIEPAHPKDFLPEEKIQEQMVSFKELIDKNKHLFGDYEVIINSPHSRGFSVIFFSFQNINENKIKGRRIIQNGEDLGECCEFCDPKYKLLCLVKDTYDFDGKCDQNKKVQKEIVKLFNNQFDFHYPKKDVISFLSENGFQEAMINNFVIKDTFDKNGIRVFVH